MGQERHPLSPRLDHCPEGLPKEAYLSEDWYSREMALIFGREWVCVGRLADVEPGTMRRATLGAAEVILCRTADGALSAFHNACRHRGAELCSEAVKPLGALVRCPYHAWAYAAFDGRLVATGPAVPTADFDRGTHGLVPVAHRVWNGFVFLSAGAAPPDLSADVPLGLLDHWPMEGLVTGHRWTSEIACNWKGFWENYSECLHCPGIHPELCEMVPVYRTGVMGPSEALGWTPDDPVPGRLLREGAESWTPDGALCGPVFPGLTEAEREVGHTFVTMWPSVYVVAHADHVRSVRIEPLGPERTRLVAEWYFAPETLVEGFDAAAVAAFAKTVMTQDGAAAEMNHRGLRSPSFKAARLMPEEYEIHRFHRWIAQRLEAGA